MTDCDEVIHECLRLWGSEVLKVEVSRRKLRAERPDGRFVEVKLTDNDFDFGLAYISNALLEPALGLLRFV